MTRKKRQLDTKPEFCPICGKMRNPLEFERHHVVWRTDGGSSDPVNLLDICCTCHAIITRGCAEDRVPRDQACFALMLSIHGLTFLLKSNVLFSNHPVWGEAFVEKYKHESAEKIDVSLRQIGDLMLDKCMDQIIGNELVELPVKAEREASQ